MSMMSGLVVPVHVPTLVGLMSIGVGCWLMWIGVRLIDDGRRWRGWALCLMAWFNGSVGIALVGVK
jgi:hypothetical protein